MITVKVSLYNNENDQIVRVQQEADIQMIQDQIVFTEEFLKGVFAKFTDHLVKEDKKNLKEFLKV